MHYALIETALGTMALGWTEAGVARFALPGLGHGALRARMDKHGSEAALPDALRAVADKVVAYAEGGEVDFAEVPLDLGIVPTFNRQVYDDIVKLGWGEVTTYGAIARRLGDLNLSRAVGAALGANPIPLIIPCHRVLGADGKSGGFSAPGGAGAKMRMLALERAPDPAGQFSFGF